MSEAVYQPIENEAQAANAHYLIEQSLLAANPPKHERELWIEDQLVGKLSVEAYEFTVEWGKLIFSWWSDTHSQNWRVASYTLTEGEIRLRATRGWGHALTTIVLRDQNAWQAAQLQKNLPITTTRQAFAEAFPLWLTKHFPHARVEHVRSSKRRQRHWAIGYVKVRMRLGAENVLALGVSVDEDQSVIDGIIAAGLVWLTESNGARKSAERATRLIFCLPEQRAATVLERLIFLTTKYNAVQTECFGINQITGELTRIELVTQLELLSAHTSGLQWPARLELGTEQRYWVERIMALAPDVIEMRLAALREQVKLLWRGLEFARVHSTGRAEFGIAGMAEYERQALTEQNFSALQGLVTQLASHRCALAQDKRHLLYRMRSEAWLESVLRQDITALNGIIDIAFDGRFVYSQIPAWQAESRSVLDLLTVTREGRLAIIEVKESEDGQLPLQGLDYWWRIEQARLRGEFAEHHLFPGIELADQSPLLLLVAPRLRFHRSFAAVSKYLSPEIEAFRVGINANWREKVRVYSYDCAQAINSEYEAEENET